MPTMKSLKVLIFTIVIIFMIAVPSLGKDSLTVFLNINVVPMDSERILTNQTVIIRDGIISGIGDSGKVKIPLNAVKINGRGKYLMPGLIDSHVHLYSETEMPLYIVNGVTTVFDLNGKPATLRWKKMVSAGQNVFAPTIFSTGPKFDTVRTAAEDVSEVESQWKTGYDGIKIYPQLSREEYPALVAAAKKHGMIVVGHIPRLVGLEMAVQAGQSIAHAEEYLYTFFNEAKSGSLFDDQIKLDESRIPQAVAITKSSSVTVMPTLVTYDHIVQQAIGLDNYLKHPEIKYLAPYLQAKLRPSVNVYYNGFSTEEKKTLPANLEFQKKIVKALHAAGVPIITGTDSMGVGPVAGYSVHEELHNFVTIGFTSFEALQTATVNAAFFLQSGDKFGTVSTGKRADLLLLDANPLTDINNAARISGVMARGRWMPKAELNRKLRDLPAAYRREEKKLITLIHRVPSEAIRYLNENDPFGQLGSAAFKGIARREGISSLIKTLRNLKRTAPDAQLVEASAINNLGYMLLNSDKIRESISVFELNVEFYPNSGNVYDSLGEAFLKNGNKEQAIKNYKKSLELNPKNRNAAEILRKLGVIN